MTYACSICNQKDVKLWRPASGTNHPLICATCAEKLQSPRTYQIVREWINHPTSNGQNCWEAIYKTVPDETGSLIPAEGIMPKWIVDEYGFIPAACDTDHDGRYEYTDRLVINPSTLYPNLSENTVMEPAIAKADGQLWPHGFMPKDDLTRWRKLFTH